MCDLMVRIYKSGDRVLQRSIFTDSCRMSCLSSFLSHTHFSEMNAKDRRFPACTQTCQTLRKKVESDLETAGELAAHELAAEKDLWRARSSTVMDPEKLHDSQTDLFADGHMADGEDDTDAMNEHGIEDERMPKAPWQSRRAGIRPCRGKILGACACSVPAPPPSPAP